MPQILHTTLIPQRALTAAGIPDQVDLPTNPLSVILITLRGLNNTVVPANYTTLTDLLTRLSNINVRYRGANIISGRMEDLAMAMLLRAKWGWGQTQINDVDNDVRSLTIPLLFGRSAYDPMDCFPATRRGDLILSWTPGAAPAGIDGETIQIETIELLDATPDKFIKITETQQAMAAAGLNEIELPVGNDLLGIMLRPFTFPNGANMTSSFGEIALEVDNVETGVNVTNWETLHGAFSRLVPPAWSTPEHVHPFLDGAGPAVQTATRFGTMDTSLTQQYAYLDLDPLYDGTYALKTKGAARVNLTINSDVADGANVSRIYPVERVMLAQAAGA